MHMSVKQQIPKEKGMDNTLNLARKGYLYIKSNTDTYDSDLYETRLMGQKAVCISGEEASNLFYDEDLFQRHGAAPMRVQKTLTGVDAVQTMDGDAHRHRKQLFLSLMTPDHQKHLADLVRERCQVSISKWEMEDEIILFDEMKDILCWAACRWSGIPLTEADLKERADSFSEMVDAFGAAGPRHWRGRIARPLIEEWLTEIIENVRTGRYEAIAGSPLYEVAFHKDLEGNLLGIEMAAIELINIIRPIVAIAIYITFSALALYDYPEYKEKLKSGDPSEQGRFVQEVRRHYPLAPFLGARVKKDFTWKNYDFKEGTLVLLDVYGTNHDSRLWDTPYEFDPDRFKEWQENLYSFIPQGGGEPAKGHRCPGEGITVEMMKTALDFLVNQIDYDVPKQNLSYSLIKIPTLPKSGFVISNVKRKS